MRMYYFGRRQLQVLALMVVLVILLLAGFGVYLSRGVGASKVEYPAIYQGSSGQKAVAVNFNVDWGEDYVPAILEVLKAENVKVTFFVTGRWAEKNPDLLKKMAAGGHFIENHGYRHCHVAGVGTAQVSREIAEGEAAIQKITGRKPILFAPPYGEVDRNVLSIAEDKGYRVIMWSLDTIDWQRPPSSTIINRVVKRIHNDAIILMHPTEPTAQALPPLIRQLKEQGYKIVPVVNLIQSNTPGGGSKHVAGR